MEQIGKTCQISVFLAGICQVSPLRGPICMRRYTFGYDMKKTNNMSQTKMTIPVIAALDTRAVWVVTMSEGPDPEFTCRAVRTPKDEMAGERWEFKTADAFEVRNRVFALQTPEDALELFRACGPWQVKDRYALEGEPIRFSQIERLRGFYEDALLRRSLKETGDVAEDMRSFYLWQPLPIELQFGTGRALVRCKDIEAALRASVFLDRQQGFPWKRCRRSDCGRIFKNESKRERLYCGTDCAHLESSRNYQRRRASAAKSRKGQRA